MRRVFWMAALATAVTATAAGAQTTRRDPVGPAVVDVRLITGGLPTDAGWIPVLPADSEVASRGLGLEAGGHVYFGRLGPARLGVGAAMGWVRGTSVPEAATTPEVQTRLTTFAPQLSLNFGHRLGWSYLSAGYGAAKVASEATTTPVALAESGWVGALNFGAGARWFITDHLGVGGELRWHRLSAVTEAAGTTAAPRATLFHLAVGISIR